MNIHPLSFAFAGGVVFGLYTFVFTLVAVITGYGVDFLQAWVPLLPGYSVSYVGSLVGFVYCFVDGFIFLYLLASFYNYFTGKFE